VEGGQSRKKLHPKLSKGLGPKIFVENMLHSSTFGSYNIFFIFLVLGMDGCSLLMGDKDIIIGLLCPSQSEPDYKEVWAHEKRTMVASPSFGYKSNQQFGFNSVCKAR
jgi:hypothetical protein